jgi:hypothetical protein
MCLKDFTICLLGVYTRGREDRDGPSLQMEVQLHGVRMNTTQLFLITMQQFIEQAVDQSIKLSRVADKFSDLGCVFQINSRSKEHLSTHGRLMSYGWSA